MNCYYKDSISRFVSCQSEIILGQLAVAGGNDPQQMFAWEKEISLLKSELLPWKGEEAEILFEYTIPRLAKRADAILLLRGIIFVIEFKVGQTQYLQQDVEQVMDYALDLKNFHKESHSRTIVPILVASDASDVSASFRFSVYNDNVYNPILVNSSYLQQAIIRVLAREKALPEDQLDLSRWHKSRYEPTPTIIEAASALYLNHSVDDITKTEASGESLKKTTDYILNIIRQSRERKEKSICFLTGVPGAGKTLVGLNVAIQQTDHAEGDLGERAVYLSGNGPLVKVLTAALARDKKEREHCKYSDAEREVRGFIQEIYSYREQMLNKIKTPIVDGKLEIDETVALADKNAGYAEIEHIAIFDEAQRSWTHQKLADWLARGGSYGNKKKVPDFPMSEAEFLIWSLNLRKDWAVIVCLVGGGQEIHTGEAGIAEWIKAINTTFPGWKIYISDHLTNKEYAEGRVNELLSCSSIKPVYSSLLHLSVSQRQFRAERLSDFVHKLLDLDKDGAAILYQEIKKIKEPHQRPYQIKLTRDIEKAKQWLKTQARGSERYGIIVSSKAERLRPLAIDVKRNCDVVHWFLDDKKDLRSSLFLEDVATEFDVQGLELDWSCVTWDGDLRYTADGWDYNVFSSNQWRKNRQSINQEYQLNAYRVLLTRARQGMIICVPTGNPNITANGTPEDPTRLPEFYDSTYQYLKSIGIEEI